MAEPRDGMENEDEFVPLITDDRQAHWCSWCFQKSTHKRLSRRFALRVSGVCGSCERPVVACSVPGCSNRARSTGTSSDAFCAVHGGVIRSFGALHRRVADPTEFTQLFKDREGINVKRLLHIGAGATIGFGITGPLALAAAPAIGGFIGVMGGLSGAAATSAGLALVGGGSLAAGGLGMAGGTAVIFALGSALGGALGGLVANTYVRDVPDFEMVKVRDGVDPAVIAIDGFLSKGSEPSRWLDGVSRRWPGSAVYHVQWDTANLLALGQMLSEASVTQAFAALAKKLSMSASKRAAGPIGILTLPFVASSVARNPWHRALVNSEKVGSLIAECIARCESRQFILIGHSLGARAVVSALVAYGTTPTERRASRIISAHLLGGAISADPKEGWELPAGAVDHRIENYWSERDQVLKIAYRMGVMTYGRAAGIGPIPTIPQTMNRLVSIDATDLVPGHTAYHENLAKVLSRA